jgi:hypothetical protein
MANYIKKNNKKQVKFAPDPELIKIHQINNRDDIGNELKGKIWYSCSELALIRSTGTHEVRMFMVKNREKTFSGALRKMHGINVYDDIIKTHIIAEKMKCNLNDFDLESAKDKITLRRSVTISFNLNEIANRNQITPSICGKKNKQSVFANYSDDSDDSDDSGDSDDSNDSDDSDCYNSPISFSLYNVGNYGDISSAWE